MGTTPQPAPSPPDATLVTPRLRLRLLEVCETDAALYRALYSCPRVMAQIAPPLEVAAAEAAFARVCRHNARAQPGHRTWVVEDRATGDALGIVALHRAGARAELGLMLLPRAWNGRTSCAALAAVIEHGFDAIGLELIEADCREGTNTRILDRLLLPLGFERVPALRPGYALWALPVARWKRP